MVVKITVSSDSQTVITQPSPLRIKAGRFAVVGIEFTQVSWSVSLPQGTVIEFAIKPRNLWTGGWVASTLRRRFGGNWDRLRRFTRRADWRHFPRDRFDHLRLFMVCDGGFAVRPRIRCCPGPRFLKKDVPGCYEG